MNAIKISVLVLFSFLVVFKATAQIQFGVKAGLNLSMLNRNWFSTFSILSDTFTSVSAVRKQTI